MKNKHLIFTFASITCMMFLLSSCGEASPSTPKLEEASLLFTGSKGECGPIAPPVGNCVRNIHQDHDGNLWFGTNGYGVARYDGEKLTYFSIDNGFSGNQVTDIREYNDGKIWFATYGGISIYDGESFRNYTVEDGLSNEWVWCVHKDRKGDIWAGTAKGLCKLKGSRFEVVQLPASPVNNPEATVSPDRITDILEDRDGDLWFSSDGCGVYRFDGQKFSVITNKDGLCDNTIYRLFMDRRGNIWFGSMFGGLSRYDGNEFISFSTKNGILGDDEVCEIYEDRAGNIWFSSEGFGLYRYDGNSFRNYAKKEGLGVLAVQAVLEDKDGRFWVGGCGGLYRLIGTSFVHITQYGPWKDC
ncbi:MAG: hypothetical protein EP338_01750 [Bacteroidetes bacterium]|nr:MAG: hypothetical protein EP338_01750 [Bacteroidota bacterium]